MLPTDYQKYYVYSHFDPSTEETVYVGKGTSCRAFRAAGSGHRSTEHSEWLENCYCKGEIPVEFVATGLTKERAFEIEDNLIKKLKPKFNRLGNPDYRHSKFDDELVEFAKELREGFGYSYTQVSFLLGAESLVSRENTKQMTIWRMING